MHIPVLKKEVLEYLDPKPSENFIDCTIGLGGHTTAILEKNAPKGKVLGIELDPELYEGLKCLTPGVKQRMVLVNDNFVNLKKIVEKKKFKNVSGILFDLGMSTWHLKQSGRGFSFMKDEPLNMRYDIICFRRSSKSCDKLTAEKIVNKWPEKEIEKILKEYGEERFAKKIAKEIIKERKIKPIQTTFQLVEIINKAVPKNYERGRIHPATRTFQALRIAVNDELNNLKKALPQALEVLIAGGRIVVISFHSLEDRIVKNFFRQKHTEKKLRILTKKPIRPSEKEVQLNPSSRSAKLRAALKPRFREAK